MADTAAKKEKQKKKAKEKQEKAQKMKERKINNNKGKPLEEMMAYVDENGDLSSSPPDPRRKKVTNAEDISLSASRPSEPVELIRKGIVTYFNDSKGYGFITDMKSRENIFMHTSQLQQPVKEGNLVTFETERGPKGYVAVRIKKDS